MSSSSKNPISLPQQEEKKETWGEWGSRSYGDQKEKWTPWLEDQYLRWFGKDNKASYATKGIAFWHTPCLNLSWTNMLQTLLARPK
jgi:hypothetical protein